MQIKPVWWTLGLAAALAAILLFNENDLSRRMGERRPAIRPGPLSESERAAKARYLTANSERKFAPLLALLATTTTTEDEQRLSAILAQREITLANAREESANSGLSFEAYCDAQIILIEQQITTELGADVTRRVREYIRSLPQRLVVSSIEHILIYRGAAMTVEQMEQLVALLKRREVLPPPRRPSTEEWERFLDNKERAHAQIMTGAAEFLSPPQLAALRQELDLQVGLMRMQGSAFTPANAPRPSGAVDARRENLIDAAAPASGTR